MSVSLAEMKNIRPPLFRFELVPVEDRAATEALNNGSVVMKDEAWVFVQQLGSRDEIPFPAEQWLAQMEQDCRLRPKSMPRQFVEMFKQGYRDFRNGVEQRVNGTSVRHVSIYTPAEVANLIRINIQAVEDAAMMNDEALRRYGLGGVQVKQKSQDWLKTRDSSQSALEMTQLRQQNQALQGQIEAQQEALNEMRAQLAQLNAATKSSQVKKVG
jgi:hypothetical protein